METVKTIKEVRQKVREWRADGLTIGLVPTMGFLHEGQKPDRKGRSRKRPSHSKRLRQSDSVRSRRRSRKLSKRY